MSKLAIVVKGNTWAKLFYWSIEKNGRPIAESVNEYSRKRDAIRYAEKLANEIGAVLEIEKDNGGD
jgi:hypothetical protein